MSGVFFCSETEPTVETVYGPVHGIYYDGVYIFKGVRYARAGRFLPPEPPLRWTEPADCFCYGFECPKMQPYTFRTALYLPRTYWPSGEDCHYLNIWSPTLDPTARKPVMVWFHGGGYGVGSGNAHTATEGSRLAAEGEVVVVTLNHRLNWLGYLDLSAFGARYANSVNAGNEDLVFALRWVRENIAAFGGDPDRVTLFGQSGGGMKILDLLQTPAAEGLFHRGIVQSGVTAPLEERTPEAAERLVLALLAQLGLGRGEVRRLETLPYAAVSAALTRLPGFAANSLMAFRPQRNHWYRGDLRRSGLTAWAKEIDLILGSTLGEFQVPDTTAGRWTMDAPEVLRRAASIYGAEQAPAILYRFRAAYPDRPLFDALYLDSDFRRPTLDLLDRLADEGHAAYYNYLMAFDLPIGEGIPMRHSMDNPYVFRTTGLVPACNRPGETERLEREISGAWLAFAHTGDPNHLALPVWARYDAGYRATMVFGTPQSGVRVEHDRALSGLVQSRRHTRTGE